MPEHVAATMRVIARESREHCGFLFDDWAIVVIKNIADKDADFEMDPDQMLKVLREDWEKVIAVWHTHPRGREMPSSKDVEWAPVQWRYFIVTPEVVVEWNIADGPSETWRSSGTG